MSEQLSSIEQEDSKESRFGNHETILEILESDGAEILTIEDIDSIRPELKGKHHSRVELAKLKEPTGNPKWQKYRAVTLVRFQNPEKSDTAIEAIFKPFSGEDPQKKREFGLSAEIPLFRREKAAYLIDHFLGFDTVPPTGIRQINGETGMICLYIDPEVADIVDLYPNEEKDSCRNSFLETADAEKIAILSYLIHDADSNYNNILISKNRTGGFNIDLGYAFLVNLNESDIQGPRREKRGQSISPEIKNKITGFLKKRERIAPLISGLVGTSNCEAVFKRAQLLLEKGIIL